MLRVYGIIHPPPNLSPRKEDRFAVQTSRHVINAYMFI